MSKIVVMFFIIMSVLFNCAQNSFADRRRYVWTYEYQTMPKGMAEFEYYMTTEVPDTGRSSVNTWKHWAELEYGITNRWDISMYQMWKQTNGASSSTFGYDGFKLRARYRIGEKGLYIVDPLLYFEYKRDDDLSKPNVGEIKLILAKDIDKLNMAYNQIAERDLDRKGKIEYGYAVGMSYAFLPHVKIGIESKGSYSNDKYAIGPTVLLASKKFWASFGAVLGLNEKTDDIQTRLIIGVPF